MLLFVTKKLLMLESIVHNLPVRHNAYTQDQESQLFLFYNIQLDPPNLENGLCQQFQAKA
jgi:hypothetical protein